MYLADLRPTVFSLQTDAGQARYTHIFGQNLDKSEVGLQNLARALSTSPLWREMPRTVLVVRSGFRPLIGAIGYFDPAGKARLEALQWQLEHVLPHLKYVSYAQAEMDCARLAGQLLERFGGDELQDFRFVAVPRGGNIVLGMLAYALGLRQSQLEPPYPPERPLMVVDDCAISGLRFRHFLERWENRRIVFAQLYSPVELRKAIENEESRDVTCLSAHDLHDRAPERLGHEYAAWQERWFGRMKHRCYWVGQPDQVCFAWNEPDIGVWNLVTEQEESGWRFVPPEFCLKNRLATGMEPIPVQVQPEGRGPLKPPAHVLFGDLEGQVVVGELKAQESFVLESVGADMWRAIVEYESLDEASRALLRSYDVDRGVLKADLHNFAEDLLSQGLLEKDG